MRKYVWFSVALLAIDWVTKVIADLALPYNEPVGSESLGIFFHLIYNMGNQSTSTLRIYKDDSWILTTTCVVLALSILIPFIRRKPISTQKKLGISAVCCGLVAVSVYGLIHSLKIQLSTDAVMMLARVSIILFMILFFPLIKTPAFKYLWVAIIAGGIGNTVNLMHPPYRVIDFIRIDWVTHTFGIGIFNFADIYLYGSVPLLFGTVLYGVIDIFRLFMRRRSSGNE